MASKTNLALVAALLIGVPLSLAQAQTGTSAFPGVDPGAIEDLVIANRILANEKVLDGFGHVSIRDPRDPNRYLMSRSIAPATVTADDIMEYDHDTRVVAGPTNLLVDTPALGKAIAQTLGKANIVLMRGHGDTVVGPNVRLVTFWAIYAEVNARQLAQAIAIGGPITFIEGEEQKLAHDNNATAYERPWQMWKREAMRSK